MVYFETCGDKNMVHSLIAIGINQLCDSFSASATVDKACTTDPKLEGPTM